MSEDLKQKILAAKRLLAADEAKDDLRAFMRFMIPDSMDPEDASRTEYQDTKHGKLLCEIIEKVETGELKRTAVAIPPQHGKTIHLSIYGPAWIIGRNPRAKIIVATYNEIRASELGGMVRKLLQNPRFKQVFPDFELQKGSQSTTHLGTTAGGTIFFVGAGGTVTGRTGEYFIIDDPIKDDQEVQSDKFREDLWKWFFSVAYSRGSKRTRMVVLHTRWHGDDLIGRLVDPDHPERNKRFDGVADDWIYLNLSGVIEKPELAAALGVELEVQTDPKIVRAFGTKPIAALWPEDKDLAHFAAWKIAEPQTFSALVMGKPVADEGNYFKQEMLVEYSPDELPDRLRMYGASDHAVSTKQGRDYTVIGCVGIDEKDDIWIMPDLVWDRMETDQTVEAILTQLRQHHPMCWWMENELISKSFGPFLKKRMMESKLYTTIDPVTPSKDKPTRARAIQGRMSMRKVRFPRYAAWWQDAKRQMLQFPQGANDDFVDWLSHIGQGLLKEISASQLNENSGNIVKVGSVEWTLAQSKARASRAKRTNMKAGW